MILESLIEFVLPKVCVGCGKWETFLCEDCVEKLDYVSQICPMCGEDSLFGWTHKPCHKKFAMDGLIYIYEYREETMRKVIDGIKYGFNKDLIKTVLQNFVFETGTNFDFLIPIPLYFYRQNWRGFNQAEEIAKEVMLKTEIPVENALIRNRNTKQQVTMKSKEEREANIKDAFSLNQELIKTLKGKKILLVDDVFTSGADMKEAAKVLKTAGASIVWGLALAH